MIVTWRRGLYRLLAFSCNPFVLGLLSVLVFHLVTETRTPPRAHQLTQLDVDEMMSDRLETNSLKESIHTNKDKETYVRPRFIRDEINMTQDIFVGLLVSEGMPRTFLSYLNKTLRGQVAKTVLFADNSSSFKNESNVLLLKKLSMQHMIDYVGTHHPSFSYYLFALTDALVDGRRLAGLVTRLAFHPHVILGVNERQGRRLQFNNAKTEQPKNCDIETGLIVNNDALKTILQTKSASGKVECVSELDGVQYTAASLQQLDSIITTPLLVYGLQSERSLIKASLTLLKNQATSVKKEIYELNKEIETFVDESAYLEDDWPNVAFKPHIDVNRFDNEEFDFFNFDDSNHIADNPAEEVESQTVETIQNDPIILELVEKMAEQCAAGQHAKVLRAWRKVDMNVGVKWTLELQISDTKTVDCSVFQEFSDPIMISFPFVTEATKISLVVPVSEQDVEQGLTFLNNFAKTCLLKNDRVFLMLVFLYTKNHPDKNNNNDFFKSVKQLALQLSKRFKKKDKGSMILWYSMQLKESRSPTQLETMDLLAQKLDSTSIILIGSPHMELHTDYLNRVRMNTIQGRLAFCPIPFTQFHPSIIKANGDDVILNTSHGHFDGNNFQHISFYKTDFLRMRERLEIAAISKEDDLLEDDKLSELPVEVFRLSALFYKFGYLSLNDGRKSLHVLRAPESSLRLRYKNVECSKSLPEKVLQDCLASRESSLGSRSQLAKLFLDNNNQL